MASPDRLTIRRPDDFHVHLRDGPVLAAVAAHTAEHFARALVMPNLLPPVVTGAQALAYRERIMAALPAGSRFEPLMSLYLTEGTDPTDVMAAARDGLIQAVKLYPAGATTNSQSGVRDLDKVMPVLATMAEIGLPLCVHGEVTDPAIDIFDREAVFIDKVLTPLRTWLPDLKVVLEHVTTAEGVDYVKTSGGPVAGTLTPHHLMLNRNDLLVGGVRPHYYCLPIVKRERHRLALRAAATSGDARFFLGTDTAPHLASAKESACGCAGIFNAPNAMSCVAQVFEDEGALDQLEAFTSLNGAAFYGLPANDEKLTLVRQDIPVAYPATVATAAGEIAVFDPGTPCYWRVGEADIEGAA